MTFSDLVGTRAMKAQYELFKDENCFSDQIVEMLVIESAAWAKSTMMFEVIR